MKDVIRSAPVRALGTNRDIAAAAGWHVLTAVAGLVASHAVIADRLIPFGLSFAAGIPAAFAPSAAVGAFLGYLVSPLESGNFRYIKNIKKSAAAGGNMPFFKFAYLIFHNEAV